MRESAPHPLTYLLHVRAHSFTNAGHGEGKEIFMARKAFEACLISSALFALVRSKFARNGPVTGPGIASGLLK